jgi:hypothetical protein
MVRKLEEDVDVEGDWDMVVTRLEQPGIANPSMQMARLWLIYCKL